MTQAQTFRNWRLANGNTESKYWLLERTWDANRQENYGRAGFASSARFGEKATGQRPSEPRTPVR